MVPILLIYHQFSLDLADALAMSVFLLDFKRR